MFVELKYEYDINRTTIQQQNLTKIIINLSSLFDRHFPVSSQSTLGEIFTRIKPHTDSVVKFDWQTSYWKSASEFISGSRATPSFSKEDESVEKQSQPDEKHMSSIPTAGVQVMKLKVHLHLLIVQPIQLLNKPWNWGNCISYVLILYSIFSLFNFLFWSPEIFQATFFCESSPCDLHWFIIVSW